MFRPIERQVPDFKWLLINWIKVTKSSAFWNEFKKFKEEDSNEEKEQEKEKKGKKEGEETEQNDQDINPEDIPF